MIRSAIYQKTRFRTKVYSSVNVERCRNFLMLLLGSLCFYSMGYAQVISGTVYDKSTSEVIPFASIYFNGTAIGTTSNENGNFELTVPKELSNPLIVSSVGFYSETLTNFLANEKLSVQLVPKTYDLLDVEVTGDESRNIRKAYFPKFRIEFLGKKLNPRHCRILNESDILLHYDRNEKSLKAFAMRPIQIQNDELGYKISYFLDRFEFNLAKHSLVYIGNYIFAPLNARDRRQQNEFEKRRGEAYLGSRMHLFRSLWDGSLEASGFRIVDSTGTILPLDKLVVSKKPSEGAAPQKFLVKRGPMLVFYKGFTNQTKMYLQNDFIPFDENGYFDPLGIVWDGDLGEQRIADLLPFEYIYHGPKETF